MLVSFYLYEDEYCLVVDILQIVLDILDEDSCLFVFLVIVEIFFNSLKFKFIQDCMWNGFNYESVLDVKVFVVFLNMDDFFFEILCVIFLLVEYVSFDCVDFLMVFFYFINELY